MNEHRIADWKQLNNFLDLVLDKEKQKLFQRYFFRGQSDESWELESSIARIIKGDELSEKKAKYYEQQGLAEFKSIFQLTNEKLVYSSDMDELALLMDMQHYSCPTRLLDWSTSPYVALYFSISENLNKDSSLFIWDYAQYLATVKEKYLGFRDLGIKELIAFEEFDHVQILLPTKKNERLYKQQGLFSASNNILKSHCKIVDNLSSESSRENSLTKLIVPHEKKLDFLDRLRYMNITANTLFPCLDGIGREIKESLLLRKWKEKINFA